MEPYAGNAVRVCGFGFWYGSPLRCRPVGAVSAIAVARDMPAAHPDFGLSQSLLDERPALALADVLDGGGAPQLAASEAVSSRAEFAAWWRGEPAAHGGQVSYAFPFPMVFEPDTTAGGGTYTYDADPLDPIAAGVGWTASGASGGYTLRVSLTAALVPGAGQRIELSAADTAFVYLDGRLALNTGYPALPVTLATAALDVDTWLADGSDGFGARNVSLDLFVAWQGLSPAGPVLRLSATGVALDSSPGQASACVNGVAGRNGGCGKCHGGWTGDLCDTCKTEFFSAAPNCSTCALGRSGTGCTEACFCVYGSCRPDATCACDDGYYGSHCEFDHADDLHAPDGDGTETNDLAVDPSIIAAVWIGFGAIVAVALIGCFVWGWRRASGWRQRRGAGGAVGGVKYTQQMDLDAFSLGSTTSEDEVVVVAAADGLL